MTVLVAIPGIMSDARTWSQVSEGLKAHFDEVHVADTTKDSSLEAMAERALAETSGDLVILAHSMGTRIAMEMGRLAPQRVKAIVLSSGSAEGPAANEREKRQARIDEANADMVAYAKNWAPKVISKAKAQDEKFVESIRQMVIDCTPEIHERQNLALLHRNNAESFIGEFTFPVLLISGSEDHISTEAVNRDLESRIPDAKTVIFPGAGHLLTFEQPQEVLAVISSWLKERAII